MRFVKDLTENALEGILVYSQREHSLSFTPSMPQDFLDRVGEGSVTSLLIGTLQIEVATNSGALLYVWGYHPSHSWKAGDLEAPFARRGSVTVHPDRALVAGVSISLKAVGDWPTVYDPHSGWLRVGLTQDGVPVDHVLFAEDAVASLSGEELTALWLRPSMVP
jgi:hypothetical protein